MKRKTIWIIVVVLCATLLGCVYYGIKASEPIFQGYEYKYMNGYSSIEYTGYHVYDGVNLPKLDQKPSFQIIHEDEMPVLDGIEVCYPLYNTFAVNLYKNIGNIEISYLNDPVYKETNGKIVTYTDSAAGFKRLVDGDIDLMFGEGPTLLQKEYAEKKQISINSFPIAKEALVFFVNSNNPVNDLSSEQIRMIFSGKITNWKEVGGIDQSIFAFQLPETSGPQRLMREFMSEGNTALMSPLTFDAPIGKAGTQKELSKYINVKGAIGYTYRYYLTELQQEKNVKILSVNNVYPTVDTIVNNEYPVITYLCVSKISSNTKYNTQRVIDFLLSDEGQILIEKAGYCPLSR